MIAICRIAALALLLMSGAVRGDAGDLGARARVDAGQSQAVKSGRRGVQIDLHLSQGVPYRLFLVDGPPRLVADFREVDWAGLDPVAMRRTDRIAGLRFGQYRPGWSRMVAALETPMRIEEAGMTLDRESGAAHLRITLTRTDQESFTALAGVPNDPRWDLPAVVVLRGRPARPADAPLVVVLDPGHGGKDPGAVRNGVSEKDLMLVFARELREVLLRAGGFDVVMTRSEDRFVSLERRVAVANRAQGDVFIALHADSLAKGQAHGAVVHVLSEDAGDFASAKLAERHNRADVLPGAGLETVDDTIAGVLLDLARTETAPRTMALARAVVDGMAQRGGPLNNRPVRTAEYSVLKSADIPSILLELGFLSSPRDFVNLTSRTWRQRMAEGIRAGLEKWRARDASLRPLVRQ